MQIEFNQVTPAPLAGVTDLNTEIWEKSFSLDPGKYYQVYAPSGKGKSTFIHFIYGLRFDFEGEIKLGNQLTKSIDPYEWAELRQKHLSIVFQDLRLFSELSVKENLSVKSALNQYQSQLRIDEMIEKSGISHVMEKKSKTLSYGERQRVAIIRALIQPFDWLLLDEPFSHLDRENSLKAADLISEEVKNRKAGLILTSLGEDEYFNFDKKLRL